MVGKRLPLELIMREKRAATLRHHYYSDLETLSRAYPKRIAKILDISSTEARRLIDKAKEKVNDL